MLGRIEQLNPQRRHASSKNCDNSFAKFNSMAEESTNITTTVNDNHNDDTNINNEDKSNQNTDLMDNEDNAQNEDIEENDVKDNKIDNTKTAELTHANSAFEVVEKDDIDTNADELNNVNGNQLNIANLSSIAPNVFNSFPKEYIETLLRKLNERTNDTQNTETPESTDNIANDNDDDNVVDEEEDNTEVSNHSDNSNNSNGSISMSKLKNIGGTLAQQLPALFDATQLTNLLAQFKKQQQKEQQEEEQSQTDDKSNHDEDNNAEINPQINDDNNLQNDDNENKNNDKDIDNKDDNNDNEEDEDDIDSNEYEYEYYHTKMNHDIEWNTTPNDELFIISKDLFDIQDNDQLFMNDSDNDNDTNIDKNDRIKYNKNSSIKIKKQKNNHKKNGNNTSSKSKTKKWKFSSSNKKKEKNKRNDKGINDVDDELHNNDNDPNEHKEESKTDNNNNNGNNNNNKSGFSLWTESFNSMITHAKHKMYTMLANPSLKWDSRNNRHLFSLSHDVWIMGNHYDFNNNDDNKNSNKQVMQSIVLDIYSKIWITYRSKFENILSSRYTSDAGWGCMLRTTQMMTAQALIIYYFDYSWKLTDLNDKIHGKNNIKIYYDEILSLFNDTSNVSISPLSIHCMISHGHILYDKPVGHWYAPMQTCIMISKCIENYKKLNDKINCIVSNDNTIYKSDISLNKSNLIFVPIRLGLDSLNSNYIELIKQCFHLKECIGIVGGKPQKSLYFIGYQDNNLFYLDPHTVFPTPNINKSLSKQKCVFHCQEINSLFAKQLDPSMAIAFFIKSTTQKNLNSFWKSVSKLMNHQYSIFSLAEQRPNYEKGLDEFDNNDNDNDSDSNFDNEWEKI